MESSVSLASTEKPRKLKRIGELLVNRGFLTTEDLVKTIQHQISEKKIGKVISLGEAITELNSLSKKISLQIGEILLGNGLATMEDMTTAFMIQQDYQKQGKTKFIGEICVEDLKIISRETLDEILSQQRQIQPNMISATPKSSQEQIQSIVLPIAQKLDSPQQPEMRPASSPKTLEWLSPNKLKLGEALIKEHYINEDALKKALKYQKEQREGWKHMLLWEVLMALNLIDRKKFLYFTNSKGYSMQTGELLLAYGLINKSQLEEAMKIQMDFRNKNIERKIGDILIEDMWIVSRERFIQIIARQKDMVRVCPKTSETNMSLFFLFSKETLKKYNFIPYKIYQSDDGGYAITIIYHENSGDWVEHIRREISRKYKDIILLRQHTYDFKKTKNSPSDNKVNIDLSFDYAPPEEISAFLKKSFEQEIALRNAAERDVIKTRVHADMDLKKDDVFKIGKKLFSSQNQNLNMFAEILMRSIDLRASDIHIEPMRDKVRVRIRVDGILLPLMDLPLSVKEYFIQGLKHVFHFKDAFKRDQIFDGRKSIHYVDKNTFADLRFSVMPYVNGEKLVTRILIQNEKIPSLGELGIHKNIARKYELICSMANGIVIVTGPTGSGKTTTLHSTLASLNTSEVNIVTIENPPEYVLPGANQINAGGHFELPFPEVLKGVLRQDPDVIMFGEMRDKDSAEAALTAGLTGHLLFSTLHTNDAVSAITRLIDMGIKPFLLGSTLVSILGQRLVRKICTHCKTLQEPDQKDLSYFKRFIAGVDDYIKKHDTKFYHGKGCKECNHTGFNGRLTIVELFCVNEELKVSVLSGCTSWQLETTARKHGMTSMVEDGFYRAICGETTLGEVLRLVKTLQFPKVKRNMEEIERLLVGEMSETEIENAVYGEYNATIENLSE